MDTLKVLVTGAGAPGLPGTVYSLKNNPDNRSIDVVGVDARSEVIGKYICERFYKVPYAHEDEFIPELLEICRKEKVRVILPQVTKELGKLAQSRRAFLDEGVVIAVSDRRAIEIANNKYELSLVAEKAGVPIPELYKVKRWSDLEEKAVKLGYPEKPVVVKPPVSSGMRGLRIISEEIDLKRLYFENKPTSLYIKLQSLYNILGERFPDLLVMEYLPGPEYTVDILAWKGEPYVVIPRKRIEIKCGITFIGVAEKNEDIIEYSRKLAKALGLSYAFGFQFRMDEDGVPKVIECNPRIQGTMVLSTIAGANIIYGAVKLALGETPGPFSSIRWGAKLVRYWGGVGVYSGKIIARI